MHYIRFLSPPKVSEGLKRTLNVAAVVAVTTDLGDDFFPENLILTARLCDAHSREKVIQRQASTWQGRSRALKISLQCPGKYASRDVHMHVTTPETEMDLQLRQVPSILDVWSSQFHLTDKQRAEPKVERNMALFNGSALRIREETGDSIARHIWDASLGFLRYFDLIHATNDESSEFRNLVSKERVRPIRVIELGAGCGIVGIAFAQLVKSDVLLTDLDDARDVLTNNIQLAAPVAGSALSTEVLDWSEDPDDSVNTKFDLVLVSDCIYNPDTSVHLVNTLKRLARQSPPPLILLGYKQRHAADKVFFDHMQQAAFRILKTTSMQLPQRKTDEEEGPINIDFYEYRLAA